MWSDGHRMAQATDTPQTIVSQQNGKEQAGRHSPRREARLLSTPIVERNTRTSVIATRGGSKQNKRDQAENPSQQQGPG